MRIPDDLARMRVLHMASWHPNRVHPQLGNFIRRHIECLPEGVENTVLHAWPDSTRALRRREVEDVLSGDIRTLTALVPDRPPRRWRVERAYTRLCERLQREGYQPDLIHLHVAADAAMPAVHWAERWGLPLVISENWTAYHSEHGRAFRGKDERAVRRALQGAAMHLPVSEHLGRAMARFAPDVPQRVVPNVVGSEFALPAIPLHEDGPLKLLHVSSLIDDHKNITGMLNALSVAVQKGAEIQLDIHGGAGEGGEAVTGYRQQCERLGLSGCVTFHGPASSGEVAQAMQAADGFVLFSRYENLPCVLLEAWCTGLPVIATDVGGVAEHLQAHPEWGTLLASEDEAGLAESIVAWSQRKQRGERGDAQAMADVAQGQFHKAAVGAAMVEVYRSVTG